MTPKEKADELVTKYRRYLPMNLTTMLDAKNCAIIAVDEIILSRKDDSQFDDTLWAGGSDMYTMHPMYLKYWQEVTQEIEKL
jgi:hypothetical protein